MTRNNKNSFAALLAAFMAVATLTGTAHAQGSRKDDVVFNAQGRPMAGAMVRICTSGATGQPCSPLAPIYSDLALTQALANPLSTDGLGNYNFYAAPGRYMIEIDGPGITTKQIPNVIVPSDPSAPTFATVTATSGISAFSLSLTGNLTVSGSTAVAGSLSVGGAPVPSTNAINQWTASQAFKGPDPYRDCAAYGCVSSTVSSTGTISSGSTSLNISSAGDWQNGQYISVIGAGPTSSIAAPNLTPISITSIVSSGQTWTITMPSAPPYAGNVGFIMIAGVTDSSFDGLFAIQGRTATTLTVYGSGADRSSSGGTVTPGAALFEGVPTGSTTDTYNIVSVDTAGGYSAKSASLTVTNAVATLTDSAPVWLWWNPVSGADYYAIYRNGAFIGRSYTFGYKDDGITWPNTPNVPASAPSAAGPQTLTTTVSAGAGTTTLTLPTAASTSASSVLVFHDSASAISAALTDACNDTSSNRGGPVVTVPAGMYWMSRALWPSGCSANVKQTGAIQLITHPIILTGTGSPAWLGDGSGAGSFSYGTNNLATVYSNLGSGAVEPFVIKGPVGGKTIKNMNLGTLNVRGINLAADIQGGANGVLIDNVQGRPADGNTYGECLWSDGDAIFVRIFNFSCAASSVTSPARPSIHLSDVSKGGSFVDWTMEHIFMSYGLFYVESPACSQCVDGQPSTMQHFDVSDLKTESTNFLGVVTYPGACTGQTTDFGVGPIDVVFEHWDISDEVNGPGGYWYSPRDGQSGCTFNAAKPAVTLIHVPVFPTQYSSNTIGERYSNQSIEINAFDGSAPDQLNHDIDGGEYIRQTNNQFNNPTYFGYTNGGGNDTPSAAWLLRPPTYVNAQDAAEGTECTSGVTYYFKMTSLDGNGGETVPSQEFHYTTTNNDRIEFQWSVGASPFNLFAAYYRIYYGTASGMENHYLQTAGPQAQEWTCTAGAAGTPPTSTTAYSSKIASLSGYKSWLLANDPNAMLGIGTTTPGTKLDVAGGTIRGQGGIQAGTDTAFNASPRGAYSAFLPNLTSSAGTYQRMTLDKGITVTRFQLVLGTAGAGCTTQSSVIVTDGTNSVTLTMANGTAIYDSGAVSQGFAAAANLDIKIATPASGCTTAPQNANVAVQYRMQ